MQPVVMAMIFSLVCAAVMPAAVRAAPPAPRGARPPPIDARQPDPVLIGYQISVEPLVRAHVCPARGRCEPGVVTESVTWRIRTVFEAPDRTLIEGRFEDPVRRTWAPDRTVTTNRWWLPTDVPMRTAILVDPVAAHRAFADWSRSDDPARLDPNFGRNHDDRPHSPPAGSRCEQALLDRGFAPTFVRECRGVDDRCALALLTRGHHPTLLSKCREVEPLCATMLLERGDHPSQLEHCRADLAPGCSAALIERGHHAALLSRCQRVDDSCAVALLGRGHHPSLLDRCTLDVSPGCAAALLGAGHHPSLLEHCRNVDDRCAIAVLQRGHHPAEIRNCRR
jgi:hypothetical protein